MAAKVGSTFLRTNRKSPFSSAPQGMRHVGKNLGFTPGSRYEGVGFSSNSPDEAIQAACFWGTKTPVDIAVAQGRDGYYSCIHYSD